ncbi:MAG: hypothetical protein QM736_28665 [Vicinamibacterales bacterium]
MSIAQANTELDEQDRIVRKTYGATGRRSPLPGHPGDQCPVPGYLAEAGRFGGDSADSVPGARRRKPRAHGREHAAPGRAAAQAAGADHWHRRRVAGRPRFRPGAGFAT